MSSYIKKIDVNDAVGAVLAHDMTRIIPGQSKGVGFKKGHIVRAEDIPELLKIGKRQLYVLDLPPDRLHEDEAALRIAAAIGDDSLRYTEPAEGKTSLISRQNGMLKIDADNLLTINKMPDIIVATLRSGFSCQKDQIVAATRIIPLTIELAQIERLEQMAEPCRPIIRVKPFRRNRVGAVVTGSEIFNGLIKDEFDRFVGTKAQNFGCEVIQKFIVPDDPQAIAESVLKLRDLGCDLILTTGGLSVDPDDVTRLGIRQAGAEIIFYGTPVLPGAMFVYARLGDIPILGLPACVYYHPTTLFDLLLPRVLADETITEDDIAGMGHGGLCLQCDTCRFPVCPFGR